MICKVIDTIGNYNMFTPGACVCVAVSGGADSMSLLHALNGAKESLGISLLAAHVNHGIRGAAADADEAFVRSQCKKLGVELRVLRADVPLLAAQSGEGLEECGRRVRYEFFASLGENIIIATAHNADDRAETFLFNFARGATIRGLCSVPPVRGNIVRPLINCTKAEILDYCAANRIEYVTDETNADVAYSRNRIRHLVMPELRAINTGFDRCAARCIASLCEDDELLVELCDKLISASKTVGGYSCSALLEAHSALTKRAVSRIIEREQGITADYEAVLRVCDLLRSSGKLQLPGGGFIRVRKGILDFPAESEPVGSFELHEGDNDAGDYFAQMQIINSSEINCLQKSGNYLLECFADYDRICGSIYLRGRLEGDRITLKSRGCTKSLKKLFNESGIPPEKRAGVIVVGDEAGTVFVEGFGCDKKYCVTDQTKKILHITIRRKNDA